MAHLTHQHIQAHFSFNDDYQYEVQDLCIYLGLLRYTDSNQPNKMDTK